MEEKLLSNGESVEEIASKINKIVKEKFNILKIEKNDLEKWTSIPKLVLMDENTKNKFISFVEYLDSSNMKLTKKAKIIIALSGLIEYYHINILDYDEGSLFLLVDYSTGKNFEEIKNYLNIIGNKDLLLTVRKKTLDLDVRKKIISTVEKSLIDDKIDTTDENLVNNFISNKIKEIEETKY